MEDLEDLGFELPLTGRKEEEEGQGKDADANVDPSEVKFEALTPETLKSLFAGPNSSPYALDAHNHRIKAIENLDECTQLRSLDLSFNQIKHIENLEALKELRELRLYANHIKTVGGLDRNKKLEVLFLQDNDIETITPTLKHLRQLKKLRLDKNNIATLQHFDNLGNLVELNVSRNAIKIAKGFRHLRSLRTLRITDNSLKAIGDIPACVTLQELDFSRNRLESFKGLGSLTRLQTLRLAGNGLKSLSPLQPLPQLSSLYMQANELRGLNKIGDMFPALEALDVSDNRISGSTQTLAAALKLCTELLDIRLEGNPLVSNETYREELSSLLAPLTYIDEVQVKELPEALPDDDDTATAGGLPRPQTPSRLPPRPGSSRRRLTHSSSFALSMAAGVEGLQGVRPPSAGGGAGARAPRPLMRPSSGRIGVPDTMFSPDELEAQTREMRSTMDAMKEKMKLRMDILKERLKDASDRPFNMEEVDAEALRRSTPRLTTASEAGLVVPSASAEAKATTPRGSTPSLPPRPGSAGPGFTVAVHSAIRQSSREGKRSGRGKGPLKSLQEALHFSSSTGSAATAAAGAPPALDTTQQQAKSKFRLPISPSPIHIEGSTGGSLGPKPSTSAQQASAPTDAPVQAETKNMDSASLAHRAVSPIDIGAVVSGDGEAVLGLSSRQLSARTLSTARRRELDVAGGLEGVEGGLEALDSPRSIATATSITAKTAEKRGAPSQQERRGAWNTFRVKRRPVEEKKGAEVNDLLTMIGTVKV